MWLQESFAPSFFGFSCACHSDSFCIEQQTRLWKTCEDYKLQKQEWKQHLEASAIPTKGKPRSLCAFRSISASPEPCSKCLTSWHQIRKCLRHCLRLAYARTGFAYAHILSYAEFTLAYAHHSFAYATPLQGTPCLTWTERGSPIHSKPPSQSSQVGQLESQ